MSLLLVLVMLVTPTVALVTKYCQIDQDTQTDFLQPFFHDLYGQTTDQAGIEVAPTWNDCNEFVEVMKQAGCSPTKWFCELRQGWCGQEFAASCVHATFDASAICVAPSFDFTFTVGAPAGATVSKSFAGGAK